MTPEVKKRIEQIRQGIVPDGYTKTRSEITPTTWTPACLGDIYTERKEPGNESLPLLTVSIHSGVSDGELDEDELPKKVKRIEDKSQYKRAATGDLVFNMMRAWQGAIGTVRTEGMVSPAYIVAKPNDKVYPPFMDYYMKSARMVGIINRQSYGVTDFRKRLYWDSFAPIPCVLPPVREQRKIAEILATQDKAIELQGRKIEELKRFKKGCLEKMFPRKGQKVPEKRFPGFTDDWEQRKLEDYLTVSAEKNTGNIYGRSDVLSVSGDYGIVNQIEFQGRSFAGASVSNYGVVQTGDVVYTKSPLNSNPYGIIKTNKGKPGIVSTLYAVYHPKENAFSDFIQVYFEQHARMNNYMHPLVNKGAKNDMKVSAENALKGPVCFPSRIEQKSISAFFSVLDNLITLHQRKLEEMKKQKKALMQLLLTGIVRVRL